MKRIKVEELDRYDFVQEALAHLTSGYEVTQLEYDPISKEAFFTGGFGSYAQIRSDGKGPCEILWRGRLAEYEDLPSEEWFDDEERAAGKSLDSISQDEYLERLENILDADDDLWCALDEVTDDAVFVFERFNPEEEEQ